MSKPHAEEKKSTGEVVAAVTEKHETKRQDDNFMDDLSRNFRSFSSALSTAIRAAEKLGSESKTDQEEKKAQQELIGGIKVAMKYRQVVREKTSILEGKLRGNAKESQALHCMLRSQPCVGGRKRKFSIGVNDVAERDEKKLHQSKSVH